MLNCYTACINVSNNEVVIYDPTLQVLTHNIKDEIYLKGVIICEALCPSALVQVKNTFCNYLLQIFYDSGSQINLCNWQCGNVDH